MELALNPITNEPLQQCLAQGESSFKAIIIFKSMISPSFGRFICDFVPSQFTYLISLVRCAVIACVRVNFIEFNYNCRLGFVFSPLIHSNFRFKYGNSSLYWSANIDLIFSLFSIIQKIYSLGSPSLLPIFYHSLTIIQLPCCFRMLYARLRNSKEHAMRSRPKISL